MANFKSQLLLHRRSLGFGIFLLLSFSQNIFAQHTLPMNEDVKARIDFYCNNADAHATVKPLLDADLVVRQRNNGVEDSLLRLNRRDMDGRMNGRLTWDSYYGISRFYSIPPENAFLVRPVYDFQGGTELKGSRTLYTLAGGVILDADLHQKLGVEARFVSGITVLNNYQDSFARVTGALPGWGDRAYPLDSKGRYGFQHFSGNIIWRPSKVFNLQVGRDKHFWGDGYRSLFLSDISAAFPYIKQQTTIWKLQYTSLFAWLQDRTNSTGAAKNFRSKFATFHYISFNAAKWLNLGVFESVVWQGADDSRYRGFDPNYLSPLVFFRPVEYSLGSSDNAMLGFAFKIRFNKNNQLYSQLILDEFYLKEIKNWSAGWWANKQGLQLGYKCFNFGTVKNLFLQAEMNVVRPYTYSHGSPQQNYSHAGMPLAHPTGANFFELLGILSYDWKGLTVTGKLVGIRYGMDGPGEDFGQNIFQSYINRSPTGNGADPDFGHQLFDGKPTNIFYAEFHAAYLLRTAFPLRVELTAGARSEKGALTDQHSAYVTGGLCLPLWRAHRDF